jgi:hypothetical protein
MWVIMLAIVSMSVPVCIFFLNTLRIERYLIFYVGLRTAVTGARALFA